MAKVMASETAIECSMDAMRILGGYGFTVDFPVGGWRDRDRASQFAVTHPVAVNPGGQALTTAELFAQHDPSLTWDDLAEFVAHAARDESLRRAYVRTRERFLVAIADVIRALCDRHDLTLLVPPLEAARASSMLARGYSAERRLDPDAVSSEIFVELHAAFMRGLTVPRERSHT